MTRRADSGYALVALVAAMSVMLIGLGAAAPSWKYVMKDDREEELLFRGQQIADAIGRYQKKHGNAYPTSLEVLVKGKFLRKAYKDPMTKDGEWRFVRPGEPLNQPPGAKTRPSPPPTLQPPGGTGQALGPIVGVRSRSTEKSLRIVNGQDRYDAWTFEPGKKPVIGKAAGPTIPTPRIGPVEPDEN